MEAEPISTYELLFTGRLRIAASQDPDAYILFGQSSLRGNDCERGWLFKVVD